MTLEYGIGDSKPAPSIFNGEQEDPYLILKDAFGNAPIDPQVLVHIGRIRTASEWTKLGFPARLDSNKLSKAPAQAPYSFSHPFSLKPSHISAIQSGGRMALELGLPSFIDLLIMGVTLDEFDALPPPMFHYGTGVLHSRAENMLAALKCFELAYTLAPDVREYRHDYFRSRLATGDILSVMEAIDAEAHEIAGAVHSGMAKVWVNTLYAADERELGHRAIFRIDALLRACCSIDVSPLCETNRDWLASKHVQFVKFARSKGIRLPPYAGN